VKQCVLLCLVEAMDFIDEKDGAFSTMFPVGFRALNYFADILDTGRDGIQLKEVRLCMLRNNAGESRLAAPRRSPEHHRGKLIALDKHAKRLSFAKQMFLTDKLGK
jgi:hypothetical protein